MTNDETEKIRTRYSRRKREGLDEENGKNQKYSAHLVKEREKIYLKLITETFPQPEKIKVLEIGSGTGGNLVFFKKAGIQAENIFANELLEDRLEGLAEKLPQTNIFPGDALLIPEDSKYDIVFQSTVFTSILDEEFRKKLAAKMLRLVKPGGFVLWYDFTFNNPSNPDVKAVTQSDVSRLFPGSQIQFFKVTLAPPIGRRVGDLYGFFNLFPFLRTHLIACIRPGASRR